MQTATHSQSQNSSKTSGKESLLWITFLIWPFFAFVLAWKNIRSPNSKKIILSYYTLYGLLYVINPSMDGARRATSLTDAYQQPFSNLIYYFENLYETTLDFLDPLLIYSVSRFTDFHGVLFGLSALLFGIMSFNYLSLLMSTTKLDKFNVNSILFISLLIWSNSIFSIGGFRMWFAAWVFAYGALAFVVHKEKKYIFLASLSVIIHFSFIPISIILLLYYIMGNRPYIYGFFALTTFFVAELDLQMIKNIANGLGPAFEQKVTSYTYHQYVEKTTELEQESAWFMVVGPRGLYYMTCISLLLLYRKIRVLNTDHIIYRLFSFSLLILSFSNITSLFPSGVRFRTLFMMFAFSTLFIYFQEYIKRKGLSLINILVLPFALIFVLIDIRIGAESFSTFLLAPGIILPVGLFESLSLIELFGL